MDRADCAMSAEGVRAAMVSAAGWGVESLIRPRFYFDADPVWQHRAFLSRSPLSPPFRSLPPQGALQTRLDAPTGVAPEQDDDTAGAAETSTDAGNFEEDSPFETDGWKTLREEFGDTVDPIEKVLTPVVQELQSVEG